MAGETKAFAVRIAEIDAPIAIVIESVKTAFFCIFLNIDPDAIGFAIAPKQVFQRGGLCFLLAPQAFSDFLKQLAGAYFAFALGWKAEA